MEHTLPRPPGLVECATVLDIGAGIRPMQWYRPRRHICVEPYKSYATLLRVAGYEVVQETALNALLGGITAEAVYLLDVIEHMSPREGRLVLGLAQRAAGVQVVVYTPNGFVEQSGDAWGMNGDDWQTHRSGWDASDFPAVQGWRTERRSPKTNREPEGLFAIWDAS